MIQRVLPRYRAPFFDLLASQCANGLSVFAGEPRKNESITQAESLQSAEWMRAKNIHLFGGQFYLCLQRGLVQWLEEWNPDSLIIEANPRYLSTPRAVRWMHARGRPIIGWGLGAPVPQSALTDARLRGRQRFLEQFDAMISYSEQGAIEYRALGCSADRVFVAPNAMSPRPSAAPAHAPQFNGRPIVLYAGRLQARKRLESLMRICASLPDQIKPRLQIVGDGPEKGRLEKIAADVYPDTEFSGALFGDELAERFKTADLFVLPGTGGLAVQQAMSYGLPVIMADDYGSQPDLVTPANGWLLPPNDDAALQTALHEALSDPSRLRRMGEESFRLVQEKFNLETMVDVFVRALSEVRR
ncbi:MAG: glycosyltransferase family 4 protein [Anaerolineales bacterium]